MLYQVCPPHPLLAPFVKEYVLLDFDFTGLPQIPTKLMPARAEHSLIFYPGEPFTKVHPTHHHRLLVPHAVVQGQPLTPWQHHYPRTFQVLKVVFQPGGLYHLLGGLPMTCLTDTTADAADLVGPAVNHLREQLQHTTHLPTMVGIVDAYLCAHFRRRAPRLGPVDQVSRVLAQGTAYSLASLAEQACLSYRQFERAFQARIGISPKLFTRIARFNRAYALKEAQPTLDWLSVALACGYADYQHLVKDFKQFAGVTPVALLQADARAPERLLHLR